MSKSSVSRETFQASTKALTELMGRQKEQFLEHLAFGVALALLYDR